MKNEGKLKKEKSTEGLTILEAEKRISIYGKNEIVDFAKVSMVKILLRQIKNNFVIYLLFAAMLISFFVGKGLTAYALIFVMLLVITTGFVQEYRAEKAIKALKKMIMPVSIVIRDGKEREVLSSELVPGDIILLRSGEKIPADCLVIEQQELRINESILTGESKEMTKTPGNESDYNDDNTIFMGSFVVNGRCKAKIIHTGMNTKFGKISGMISTAEKELPLQDKVNRITKYMAVASIFFSLLTGFFIILNSPSQPGIFIEALIVVIALSVSAFPEGLPVVLITALAHGSYRMAQKNAIVNRMSTIETLGETTVICSDKTGTITKGEMTVRKIFADNSFFDVMGTGYEGKGDILRMNKKIELTNEPVLSQLIKTSVLCNDSRIERTGYDMELKVIGSPTEGALLVLAAKAGLFKDDFSYDRKEERPFNSSRKMMSVLCENGKEMAVFSKGAPEIILSKCTHIIREDGIFKLTEKERRMILEANKEMTSKSLRTVAVAYKSVRAFSKDQFEENLAFIGITGMEDPPREEVKEAIACCFRAGISVKMITGDNKDTALSIAKEIGLKGKLISGEDLDKLSEEELIKVVSEVVVFVRVKPEHKIKIVKALKALGEIVTMTGDGVNDAPALREAHIGVAMGKNGTDVSRSVADLTLKDDNFATIVYAIREGRAIFKNIRKFTSYMLSCNYAELAILLMGVLLAPWLGWQVPILLALQILFMNLVTDDLPAITLALTPSSDDIMEERPRKKEQIMNKGVFYWSLLAGVWMAFVTLGIFFISFNVLGNDMSYSRTMALAALILAEIANAYNFLSYRRPIGLKALKANKYLLYASMISITATLVIIYSPLNSVFGTVPLSPTGWLIALIPSTTVIILFNILKIINNRYRLIKLEEVHRTSKTSGLPSGEQNRTNVENPKDFLVETTRVIG